MKNGDGLERRTDKNPADRGMFVDPCGDVRAFPRTGAPVVWPRDLKGLRVGFLGNGKSNVAGFFARLADLLAERGAPTSCVLAKEGPMADGGEHRYQELADTCDLVIVGVCDGGTAASQGAVDAAMLASRGVPVVMACTDAFAPLARVSLPPDLPGVRMVSAPHPLSSLTTAETTALATSIFPELIEAMIGDGGIPQGAPDAGKPRALRDVDRGCLVTEPAADDADASGILYELGLTDGLPVFAPTPERVDAYLADWPAASETVPAMAPRGGLATPRALAANAVMAGMPRELMPFLSATVEAACLPAFKLLNLQTTTNPVTPVVVVGGRHRHDFGFNDGPGSLGGGNIANATLGRALKLCMRNLGGARAADGTDPATMGQPGKYTFCFAENEDVTSWPPLRAQTHDAPAGAEHDAVTLVGVTGTMNMIIKSTSAEELLRMIAGSIRNIGSNDYMFGGSPLLVLCPEHAEIFEREKVGLDGLRQALFELTKVPFSEFAPKNQEMMRTPRLGDLGTLHPETQVPMVATPSDFLVCVTGGSSLHSTFMHSFGGSRPVSAKVMLGERP